MKKILLATLLMMVAGVQTVLAQRVVLHLSDNHKVRYSLAKIDSISFEELVVGDYDYVDLGLPSGTLWADHNVGADNPEENGSYFAWGETEPKEVYTWDNYKFGMYPSITKYCIHSEHGTVDNITELEPEDDAASVNWGSGWQIPSEAQMEELLGGRCTIMEYTTQNGVVGFKVTSKFNGNSIFLPAAGYYNCYDDTSLQYAGTLGFYWSRSLFSSSSTIAINRYFTPGSTSASSTYPSRSCGLSVRPVCVQEDPYDDWPVTRITVQKQLYVSGEMDVILFPGETEQLAAAVYPNYAKNKTVTWESSDESIATVSNEGLVTAIAPGTCSIIARATDGSGVFGECPVTVNARLVTSIVLNDETLNLEPDGTYTLTATVSPENADNPAVTWESSDESVATVSNEGLVTAIDDGTCTITCRATDGSGIYAECLVTVADPHPYVDLGLPSGTLWAATNVGAETPEQYGTYFAWGETASKTIYSYETYTLPDVPELIGDNDAATANWGELWQMPCREQIQELVDEEGLYVTKQWTTQNGVNGWKITSKSNGNSIFLPAAGLFRDEAITGKGERGGYWGRTFDMDGYAWCIYFNTGYCGYNSMSGATGMTVRPVRVQEEPYTWPVLRLELPATLALNEGESAYLSPLIIPNYAHYDDIVLESSDESVATVSGYEVTAVGSGTCTITCRLTNDSSIYAECIVTVNP